MRILVITPYFYPHKGGSQQYAEELHYHLMKADKSVEVDVLCYNIDNSPSIEKYRGFNIYRIPCKEILKGQFTIPNYILLWKTLNRLFNKHPYTFINSHTRFFENSWWTPFVAKHFHTKSVLTDHCANHPVHTSKIVNFIAKSIDRLIIPFISKRYDFSTVTNSATFEFVKSLKMKNPTIIYGGVDTKYFKPINKNKNRKIIGIKKTFTKNDILVAFVGRMIASKGPHLLYKAASDLIKRNKKLHFIFAGKGDMYNKLTQQTKDQMYFVGQLERPQVAKLMANSDILVHPSSHHEGFPNVLLEAGVSGCAVIATNKGGTKEIIINNKTGLLIKPSVNNIKTALKLLIKNRNKRNILSNNLKTWVKDNYGWTKIVKNYQKFIDQKIRKI